MNRGSPAGRLLLGIIAIMLITVAIQAAAAGVGWGAIALLAAVYVVIRRGKHRH